MGVKVTRRWEGDALVVKSRRALGRGLIAIAENVAVKGKELAPVRYGTLRRSIHAAPVGYDGHDDFDAAGGASEQGADLQTNIGRSAVPAGDGPVQVLEVGSWLPYACVEEIKNAYLAPAVALVRGPRANAIMEEAFIQEGMKVTTS